MPSLVREIPAAPSAIALMHFSNRLTFETDCSDVHGSQAAGEVDFILLDVRGPLAFERGHVPGAINVPRRLLSAEGLAAYPKNTLFVVYCAGPHCNGAARAAVRLAAQQGAAVLALQGGDPARMPGDLPALLHRCGAYVTATGSGPWAAAVRLPLSPTLPLREPPAPADLVLDRYSAAKVYLDGLCVEDVE